MVRHILVYLAKSLLAPLEVASCTELQNNCRFLFGGFIIAQPQIPGWWIWVSIHSRPWCADCLQRFVADAFGFANAPCCLTWGLCLQYYWINPLTFTVWHNASSATDDCLGKAPAAGLFRWLSYMSSLMAGWWHVTVDHGVHSQKDCRRSRSKNFSACQLTLLLDY